MRTDPIKPAETFSDETLEDQDNVKYKQRAAIAVVFIGVFYFLFKVIFNL